MIRNTIILVFGLLILFILGGVAIYDYWLFVNGHPTISVMTRQFSESHAHKPHIFVLIGVLVGMTVGLILGFILGHLFWP